jgi:hypothetical protein
MQTATALTARLENGGHKLRTENFFSSPALSNNYILRQETAVGLLDQIKRSPKEFWRENTTEAG